MYYLFINIGIFIKILISELSAIDRLTSNSGTVSEVTTLSHEAWNDSMEGGSFVVERLA